MEKRNRKSFEDHLDVIYQSPEKKKRRQKRMKVRGFKRITTGVLSLRDNEQLTTTQNLPKDITMGQLFLRLLSDDVIDKMIEKFVKQAGDIQKPKVFFNNSTMGRKEKV